MFAKYVQDIFAKYSPKELSYFELNLEVFNILVVFGINTCTYWGSLLHRLGGNCGGFWRFLISFY